MRVAVDLTTYLLKGNPMKKTAATVVKKVSAKKPTIAKVNFSLMYSGKAT